MKTKSLSLPVTIREWQLFWLVCNSEGTVIKDFSKTRKSKVEVENWATKNGYRVVSA